MAFRRPTLRWVMYLEVLILQIVLTVFLALTLIMNIAPVPSVLWSVGAGLLTAIGMEIRRSRAVPTDADDAPLSRVDALSDAIHRKANEADDEPWTLRSAFIVLCFSPVILGFVLIRLVVIYVIPIAIVLLFAFIKPDVPALAVVLTILLPIAADILNEIIIVSPLRRWSLRRTRAATLHG